jgi:hypothetical protein
MKHVEIADKQLVLMHASNIGKTDPSVLTSFMKASEKLAEFNAAIPKVERTMAAVVAYCANDPEEGHVQQCLAKLEEARVRFSSERNDRRILIHVIGLPRVEYNPAKNRWRAAGSTKRHFGTVEQLLTWIKETVR